MNRAQIVAWIHAHRTELLAGSGVTVAGAAVYAKRRSGAASAPADTTGAGAGTTVIPGSSGMDGNGDDPIMVTGATGPAGPAASNTTGGPAAPKPAPRPPKKPIKHPPKKPIKHTPKKPVHPKQPVHHHPAPPHKKAPRPHRTRRRK